jgi:hypothetical protein
MKCPTCKGTGELPDRNEAADTVVRDAETEHIRHRVHDPGLMHVHDQDAEHDHGHDHSEGMTTTENIGT